MPFPKTESRDAAAGADQLLACYPNGKPEDPKGYITAVVSVLANFPPEVVRKVCDPVGGVPSTCRFFPSVAEITEALEREMAPAREAWGRRHRGRVDAERRAEESARQAGAGGDRAKVIEGFRKLSDELTAASESEPHNAFKSGLARTVGNVALGAQEGE